MVDSPSDGGVLVIRRTKHLVSVVSGVEAVGDVYNDVALAKNSALRSKVSSEIMMQL